MSKLEGQEKEERPIVSFVEFLGVLGISVFVSFPVAAILVVYMVNGIYNFVSHLILWIVIGCVTFVSLLLMLVIRRKLDGE